MRANQFEDEDAILARVMEESIKTQNKGGKGGGYR
jgi:hypothetical protein